jgi:4-hydroxybenzoate polyprenyltransferase
VIGILYATESEARPLLDQLQAEHLQTQGANTYRANAGDLELIIGITGIGPKDAEEACRSLLQSNSIEAIVNIGICGALSDNLKVGDLISPITAQNLNDQQAQIASISPWPNLPTAHLGTVSDPLFDTELRNNFASYCDIVDMEGAAIARICTEHATPFFMLKGVSDKASDGDHDHLHRHLDSVSQKLSDRFCNDAEAFFAKTPTLIHKLLNFVRIEHTIFSIPLLFAGAWLGSGSQFPRILDLLLITLVGVGARAFGMAINRILDRDIDAQNPRTLNRELPSGRISLFGAYTVAVAGLASYFIGCAALGNTCLYLSPIPLIPLSTYALLKRFTPLCHFGIGICLAVAPLGAYVATSDLLPLSTDILLLGCFAMFWISGFDIIYALQDIDSDRTNGVKSTPAAVGPFWAQIIAALSHLIAMTALVLLWREIDGGFTSAAAMIVSAVAFAAAYNPRTPLPARFFPLSAIACIAGACTVLLGSLP